MKHTPGPWAAEVAENGGFEVTAMAHGGLVVAARNGYDSWEHSEECKANARLMATAPELLAALERVIAISDRKHDAWDAAKAAIAKAKGE